MGRGLDLASNLELKEAGFCIDRASNGCTFLLLLELLMYREHRWLTPRI